MISNLHIPGSGIDLDNPRNRRLVRSLKVTQPFNNVWVGAAVGVAGIVAGGVEQNQAKKSAQGAANAALQAGKVNIPAVTDLASQQAIKNATMSQQLEQQLTPQVSALKTGSVTDLLGALGPNADTGTARNILMHQANTPATQYSTATPGSLQAAANAAQANLASGNTLPTAKLSTEQSNLITRQALANAGSTQGGGLGLGLGRDLTARDLGLSSLQLGQQAQTNLQNQINQAASTGQALGNFGLSQNQQLIGQSQFGQQNALQQAAALQALSSGDFAKYLSAAQLGQSIAAPTVGLDPGQVAGLSVGNSNLAGNAGQQNAAMIAQQGNNYAQLLGQLGGVGAGAISSYNKTNTTPQNGFNTPLPTSSPSTTAPDTGSYNYDLAGKVCWTARAVYGESNPAWMEFRTWMLNNMDPDFIQFYADNGQEIAEKIKDDDQIKGFIRGLMDHLKKK